MLPGRSPFLRVDLGRLVCGEHIRGPHKTTWIEDVAARIRDLVSVVLVRENELDVGVVSGNKIKLSRRRGDSLPSVADITEENGHNPKE
jgi:hypothetical protein